MRHAVYKDFTIFAIVDRLVLVTGQTIYKGFTIHFYFYRLISFTIFTLAIYIGFVISTIAEEITER